MPIATINPVTGQTMKTFDPHDAAEVERRLAHAVEAAATMRDTPIDQRATWMRARLTSWRATPKSSPAC